MPGLATKLRRRLLDPIGRRPERGATAVEYALLITFIAAVVVVAVGTLGSKVGVGFPIVSAAL